MFGQWLDGFAMIYWIGLAIFVIWLIVEFSFNNVDDEFFAVFHPSSFNEEVISTLKSKVGSYKAPLWYNSHICTVFPFGENPNLKYVSQDFDIDDAKFIVDWYPNTPNLCKNQKRWCLFFPGLGLSSRNKFSQKFLEYMTSHGYNCGVVNARGMLTSLKSSKLWFPGMIEDGKSVINYLVSQIPDCEIYLVGYSAGSHMIYKLLSDQNRHSNIFGGMSVCISHKYEDAKQRLEKEWSGRIYSMLVAFQYKQMLQSCTNIQEKLHPDLLSKILSSRYLSEYDECIHPLLGFENIQHYHDHLSSGASKDAIDIPFLALQPQDDPLHQGSSHLNINVEDFLHNPNAILLAPKHGNHFGFVEGSIYDLLMNSSKTCYTYPARVALEFFDCISRHKQQQPQNKALHYHHHSL